MRRGGGSCRPRRWVWAARRAPGLARSAFGFERWADFDASAQQAVRELREEAQSLARPLELSLIGSDSDPAALEAARANAETAGLRVNLRLAPLSSSVPGMAGQLTLTNGPLRHGDNPWIMRAMMSLPVPLSP